MLDDTMTRTVRSPQQLLRTMSEVLRRHERKAGLGGLAGLTATVGAAFLDQWMPHRDPLRATARMIGAGAAEIEADARAELDAQVQKALAAAESPA
jgi:hypothetical protein